MNEPQSTEGAERTLIVAILKNAIEDYLLEKPTYHMTQTTFDLTKRHAAGFLFDDEYLIDYPDPISPRDLLHHVDLDIDYIRRKIIERQKHPIDKLSRMRGILYYEDKENK